MTRRFARLNWSLVISDTYSHSIVAGGLLEMS